MPAKKGNKSSKKKKSKGLLSIPGFSRNKFIIFGLFFGLIGGFLIYRALAATTSVSYSGSLTSYRPTVSYTLSTGAGQMSATIKSRSHGLTVTVTDKYGTVLGTATNSYTRSATSTFNVTASSYIVTVSYEGAINSDKRFNLNITYPLKDSQLPTAVITSPLNADTVSGTTTIAATATDDTGIAKVEFYAGSTMLTADSSSPYTAAWDTTKYANGSVVLIAKSFDTSGNVAQASATVNVNNAAPAPTPVCPPGTSGTYPNCVTDPVAPPPPPPTTTSWTWPSTLANTGPAAGTSFTQMAPREFTTSDNGKTFENVQINVGDGQEIFITGSDITFKNCKIVYTGSTHSPNGFIFIGKAWLSNIRPKNILFDHCFIDGGDRHEYGIRGYYGQFSVQYSQIRGASHNIDSGGDLDSGTTINIYRNYIYDYDDNPFASPSHTGHANGIYFTGNNGLVNIEENTVIANRYEQCAAGWANGPGTGCYEFNGTGAITVYADEDTNPDKAYIVKHNVVTGGGYFAIRIYGQTSGVQSVSITNNVYTAQAGWPKVTIDGGIYVFSGTIGSKVVSGNTFGSDTVCYATPSLCAGTPN